MTNSIELVVEPSTIKNYIYRAPLLSVDGNGECISEYSKSNKRSLIKKITLLNIVGYDEAGHLQSFEPIEEANQFLLAHHIDNGKLESSQLSQGLAHYFEFIVGKQAEWDSAYADGIYEDGFDDPRPRWDFFPKNKLDKLTYQYHAGLMELATKHCTMAGSTAKGHMGAVVRFYKYWLRRGAQFNHPPFEIEEVSISYEAGASSMKSRQIVMVQSTDLRIKISKSSRSKGTSVSGLRRDLTPFTNSEWSILQTILTKTRRVIRNKDESKLHSLPIEFCLHPMICRYTGLRREEAASLHCGQIIKPKMIINDNGVMAFATPVMRFGVGAQYGSLTKDSTGGNKSRETLIPASLMLELYNYTQSKRYKKRLAKLKEWCATQKEAGNLSVFEGDDAVVDGRDYLFITQTGKPMMQRLGDFTMRWGEVRNTANHSLALANKLIGSLHNLRSTFAVGVFRNLLKKMTGEVALDIVSSFLGHEDLTTTMLYLKLAQDLPSGDEIYEDILNHLNIFDGEELDYGS